MPMHEYLSNPSTSKHSPSDARSGKIKGQRTRIYKCRTTLTRQMQTTNQSPHQTPDSIYPSNKPGRKSNQYRHLTHLNLGVSCPSGLSQKHASLTPTANSPFVYPGDWNRRRSSSQDIQKEKQPHQSVGRGRYTQQCGDSVQPLRLWLRCVLV